jgi:hypothetical protein
MKLYEPTITSPPHYHPSSCLRHTLTAHWCWYQQPLRGVAAPPVEWEDVDNEENFKQWHSWAKPVYHYLSLSFNYSSIPTKLIDD